jgi:methylthioxylose transferase
MASLTRQLSRGAAARARVESWLPGVGAGGCVLVVAVGLAIKAGGGQLGSPLPPFVFYWGPQVDSLAIVSVLAFAAAWVVVPAVIARRGSPIVCAGALYVLALALGLSLNLAHEGTRGWWAMLANGRHGTLEGKYEYLNGLPYLSRGIGWYLRHFATVLPHIPVHAQGNPPGPLIALHLLGIGNPGALAALCIGLGALTAPLAYDLGRTLGDERRGRIAGVLTAFSPCTLVFGVTSTDYAYAAMGCLVACLLVRPGTRALVAGSIVAAFASFFSWLLLAIPAWAAAVAVRRYGWRRAVSICVAFAVALAAFNGALAIASGYDPFSAVRETARLYHGELIGSQRVYVFWLFGSPVAWAVMLGLPVVWFALRGLAAGDSAAIATCALVLVASVLGFTKAETERVWLPFVPLACVAAAGAMRSVRLRPVLAFLAVQALVVEVLFFTIW